MKKRLALVTLGVLTLVLFGMSTFSALAAESTTTTLEGPAHVKVGVWLVNVEKVDLPANTYRLDFYLWFKFNPAEISLNEVKNFEFVNGQPTKYEVDANEEQGYIEYRVKGDFIAVFDFTRYPFESHELPVVLEHKTLNISGIAFEQDHESTIEPAANVAGWNLGGFRTEVKEHAYDKVYSRFIFSVTLSRPVVSAFIKSVLPVSFITTISLLAFFMAPTNFSQRITLAVTTLLAATTFHLSLLNGIPPTGYLTLADRIMISVYAIFLYNIAVSVFIMRLVDSKKFEEALKIKSKAVLFLPVIVTILVAVQVVVY